MPRNSYQRTLVTNTIGRLTKPPQRYETMKFKALTMVAIAALTITSSVATAPAKKDIVDTAVESKAFPTLVSLVQKAGLVETLKSKGPFTVFAPSEEAFKKLDKKTLDAVLNDNELLKKVLLYHVVPGKIMAADAIKLNGKQGATALKGAKVDVKVKNGKVMIDNATVIKTDIDTSNGVIHVIDTVIVPSAAELKGMEPAPAPAKSCGTCTGGN
jgi:uncharacterized surface protein with fasciclin (FAS1) repeats